MSLKTTYASESWSKVYTAFNQVNFSAFDFETIKASLLDYAKIHYAENFNDFIESSEMIMLIEMFAYVAEQINYRVDMLSHENFISTAQRKQTILKLAKIISYKPTRNIAGRGLVKITSILTTEQTLDANGNNLAKQNIVWNDVNNPFWKEQFFLIINKALANKIGQYNNSTVVNDVEFQTYTINNTPTTLRNGVYAFNVDTGLESFPMEVVSANIDSTGPFEKTPSNNSQLSLLFASDGLGDASDYTGFLFFVKQGNLQKVEYEFVSKIPNRSIDVNTININETDVWLTQVDNNGVVTAVWEQVDSLLDQNISFNDVTSRKKFEVETLENDKIRLIFGDGDYSDIPEGKFLIWFRQSINKSIVVQPNKIANQQFSFQYTSSIGTVETCSLTFSLISTIQNSAQSESTEHIRQAAPATYYSQNRMVNGQDYNTYMLKDQSILRMSSINRTFAGQPKYIDWNDASGQYENIKLFGDDLTITQEISINTISTNGSSISGRNLIDNVIEPILSSNNMISLLNFIASTNELSSGVISVPRRKFIEDNRPQYLENSVRKALKEKTLIQGAIDQHWYGEPLSLTQIGGVNVAVIPDPTLFPEDDGLIWSDGIARTVNGVNLFIPGDVGSGLQSQSWQEHFGLCFNNATEMVCSDANLIFKLSNRISETVETFSEEVFSVIVNSTGDNITVTSSIRGVLGTCAIGNSFISTNPNSPFECTLTQSSFAQYPLSSGDTFKITYKEIQKVQWFANHIFTINVGVDLNNSEIQTKQFNSLGRWEVISGIELVGSDVSNLINPNNLPFEPALYKNGFRNPNSWLIWVKAVLNPVTQQPTSFSVNFRELKLIASSKNTNFWFNSNLNLIDHVTKAKVYDNVKVLRSNLMPNGKPVGFKGEETGPGKYIGNNEAYAVVGPVKDTFGNVDTHALEIMPSDFLNTASSGDLVPDNVNQFLNFVDATNNDSFYFWYFELDEFGQEIVGTETKLKPSGFTFLPGSFASNKTTSKWYGRKLRRNTLDFMWQHYTGHNNIIDPSVSNIHDTYIITRGYYDNMIAYITGVYNFPPVAPTPLELRNQYGYLLSKKMLSDTVVLHSGKFKLLFGGLAEPQLRAKFKVVISPFATLSAEKIKSEILNVVNTYFSLENWDFGDTFYVTELLGLIHQKLPTEISTVVLVPTYSVNSFGSLFTVQSGIDEVLVSCANVNDIELVSELNATVLRQGKI